MNYYELNPEENTFKTVSIPLTHRCQLQCSNCYLGSALNNTTQFPDMEYDKFAVFLSKLPDRCDIRFIGAEPTLHKDLPEFIKLVRLNGHRPSLLTNGVRLKQINYVKLLKKSGINMIGLSMNGGLDDDIYVKFDGLKLAKPKTTALENCISENVVPHINIILSEDNVSILKPLFDHIIHLSIKHNRRFSTFKFPIALRIKSIGKMGYYMDSKSYNLDELVEITSKELGLDIVNISHNIDGYDECNSIIGRCETSRGPLLFKFTDWGINDEGIPDADNKRRGILTQDYKVAPFFEYYKTQNSDEFRKN